jgi:tetratricopeptide (TPR) repeat protein
MCLWFSALVNKGNVLFARNDYEKAREFFKEALSNDSSCVEALYNLGKNGTDSFIVNIATWP